MSATRTLHVLSAGFLGAALTLTTLVSPARAQQSGGGSTPTPGNTPSRPSAPATSRPSTPQPRMPERRLIYVSGRVVMEDGSPLPERAAIERVCSGSSRREGHTDSNGYFSIQLGDRREVFQDASVSSAGFGSSLDSMSGGSADRSPFGGVTDQELMSCELRAVIPGYRSNHISLVGRRQFDNPDLGLIVLFGAHRQRGTLVSVSSMKAPKDARKAFEKGRNASNKKKWEEARKHLDKAIAGYPEFAEAWFEMGLMHHRQNNLDEARKAYLRAAELDTDFVKPHYHMAELTAVAGEWVTAARYTRRVIELDPVSFPRVYFLDAVANLNLGNLDVAEKSARRAHLFSPPQEEPRVALLLGTVLLQKQDYKGAVEGFKAYLQHAPDAPDFKHVKSQIDQIQNQMRSSPAAASAPR